MCGNFFRPAGRQDLQLRGGIYGSTNFVVAQQEEMADVEEVQKERDGGGDWEAELGSQRDVSMYDRWFLFCWGIFLCTENGKSNKDAALLEKFKYRLCRSILVCSTVLIVCRTADRRHTGAPAKSTVEGQMSNGPLARES